MFVYAASPLLFLWVVSARHLIGSAYSIVLFSSHVTARSLFQCFVFLWCYLVVMPCCIVFARSSWLLVCDYSWSALSFIYGLWYWVAISWITSSLCSAHSPCPDYRPFLEVPVVCSSRAVLLVGEFDLWKTNFDRLNTYIYFVKRTMVHLMPL